MLPAYSRTNFRPEARPPLPITLLECVAISCVLSATIAMIFAVKLSMLG